MALNYKFSTVYLAHLVTCLPHNLKVVSSRHAVGRNVFYKFVSRNSQPA